MKLKHEIDGINEKQWEKNGVKNAKKFVKKRKEVVKKFIEKETQFKKNQMELGI